MITLRELFALTRLVHASASIQWSEWSVIRSRRTLEKAINAYDAALADYRAIETRQKEVPLYLRKKP